MKRAILLSAVVLMMSQVGFASETIPALTSYVETELSSLDSTLDQMPNSAPTTNASYDEDWMLRRIWLRLRAPMGLDVPFIVKFKIVPQIELLLDRDIPSDWASYKPVKS